MDYKRIIDISLPVYAGMITYPNNPEFQSELIKTPTTVISRITMSSHTGTHVDVPRHVDEAGSTVGEIELSKVVGVCRVLNMTHVVDSIRISDLEQHSIQKGERVLVKTKNSQRGFAEFYDDYIYLDGDAAVWLAEKGMSVFGIDSLSVKKRGGPDVRPHTELLEAGIIIFEGLNLASVEPGEYFFVGLPLNIRDGDGAPVRAILMQ